MSTYEEAGVNIEKGDDASKKAYTHAMSTFASRAGMIGEPVKLEGGYAGLLNMGEFYLVQNDDGVGTKVEIARAIQKFDTLGYDLLAMVCDDAICMGAETISITNTIDTEKVNPEEIEQLLAGLAKACQEQKIVIAGGEVAELNTLVNGFTWNASAVGVVEKDKVLTGSNVKAGDSVIGIPSHGLRSNGFTLVRHILKDKINEREWAEKVLTPCRIYSAGLLNLLGRFGQERKANLAALVHVTGGGMTNFKRVLKSNKLGVELHTLPDPKVFMLELQKLGEVEDAEAYKAWNMGLGMALVTSEPDVTLAALAEAGFNDAILMGEVTDAHQNINFTSHGAFSRGETLSF